MNAVKKNNFCFSSSSAGELPSTVLFIGGMKSGLKWVNEIRKCEMDSQNGISLTRG